MAEWKEQQFSIERKQLIEKANQAVTKSFENGAIFKKKEMIDKACDWLGMLRDGFVMRDFLTGSSYPKNDLLNDFRKAMEEL